MSASRPTAVVTGAANGIGRAITLRLAGAGYRVIAVDVDALQLGSLSSVGAELNLSVETCQLDCSRAESIEEFASRYFADTGDTLDVLVNNAGRGLEKPFYEITLPEWQSIIDLDLTGPFLMSRACWSHLSRPGASIVNISSVHGMRPLPGLAAYAAAKGGLISLTQAMALDAGLHGVRVNAVLPGFIQTRLWDDWMDAAGDTKAAEYQREVGRTVPLGRPGDPDEVAGAVLWLAGAESSYVTGTAIEVDGGLLSRAYRLASVDQTQQKGTS